MIISKKQTLFSAMLSGSLLSAKRLSVISLCLILSSCNNSDEDNVASPRAEKSLHRVEVVEVENRPVSLSQTVSGTLEAVTLIRLYNEESARITRLPYHEGDHVKQGTLLVQLDNELLKTDVAKARAAKEQAKVDLSRVKKLLPKKIATEEEVARASTVLDLAVAEEENQLIRLQRTSIRAPIDGLITRRLFEPGDLLAPQSHILSIIDPSEIRLKASLAERWIPLVVTNQAATLRIDALGDKPFSARVVRIHPTIDASTHKGIIEILLNPVPEGASVGQFARAEIELKATDRLVIPVHTIQYEPEGAYVFRVRADGSGKTSAEKVFFEQGQQFGSVTEVLTQLHPGDKIVSRGYLGLRSGKEVAIAGSDSSVPPVSQSGSNKP